MRSGTIAEIETLVLRNQMLAENLHRVARPRTAWYEAAVRASIFFVVTSLAAATAWADPTDDFIRAQMKQQNIPGIAVAVVKDGKIVKAQGYGVADIKTKAAVSPETVFKIASVSKQFIATGIMLLVQDGRLAVGDPIAKYIQDVPTAWSSITIRHVLTHTAGLVREPPAFDPNSAQFRRYIDDRVTVILLLNSDDCDDETIAFGVAELHLPDRK